MAQIAHPTVDLGAPVSGVPRPRRPERHRPMGVDVARAHRARHHLLVTSVLAVALTTAVIGVDLWQSGTSPAPATSVQEISEALGAAGAAQEAFHDLHGGYTVDPGALVRSGWQPDADVDVTLVSATTESFCLAAGPSGKAPTVWLDQSWQPLDRACR